MLSAHSSIINGKFWIQKSNNSWKFAALVGFILLSVQIEIFFKIKKKKMLRISWRSENGENFRKNSVWISLLAVWLILALKILFCCLFTLLLHYISFKFCATSRSFQPHEPPVSMMVFKIVIGFCLFRFS